MSTRDQTFTHYIQVLKKHELSKYPVNNSWYLPAGRLLLLSLLLNNTIELVFTNTIELVFTNTPLPCEVNYRPKNLM